jgi:signal transduction histidine kinase
MAVTLVQGLVTLGITAVWGRRYLGVSNRQVWEAVALAAGMLILAYGGLLWWIRDPLQTISSWSASGRDPVFAGQVWNAVIELPYMVVRRLFILLLPVGVGVPLAIAVSGVSLATAIGYLVCGYVGALAGLVPVLFTLELMLRPVLEEAAAVLPPDFGPSRRAWGLRTKALVALPSVTLFGALTVGAFTNLASGLPRLLIALGIALVAIAIAGAIFWLVLRSLLEPVEDLLDATRRVSRGDIDTPVPIVTADELGTLASGFNRMLAELRRHEDELRRSRARIVAAADDARRRVERDLHDGAQQQLVLLGMKLAMMEREADRDPAAAAAMLPETREELSRALAELRDLAHGIYPQLLESDGLPAALGDAARRSGAVVQVECDGAGRYPAEVEAAVYFCCLEALQNASKYAGPNAPASVVLADETGVLRFEIVDDGPGFDPNRRQDGVGLQNMADRVAALGGELRVSSAPGAGTTVAGSIPLASS